MKIRNLYLKMDLNMELDIEDSDGNIIYEGLADMQTLTIVQKNEILNMTIDSIELGSGEKSIPVLIIYVHN